MSGSVLEGQARLAPIARAIDALLHRPRAKDDEDDGASVVDVDGLLPAWRALSPACHPRAAADVVDVAALAEVLRRRPDLLAGGRVVAVDDDPRGGTRARAVARALADALLVRLEGKKLAFGLPVSPAELRAAFASPQDARAVLEAVRDLSSVIVDAGAARSGALPAVAVVDRPVHVVVGAGARRVLDLLSPWCQRLRVDLALLGRDGAAVDDEDLYRGAARLFSAEPGCIAERRARDAQEGSVDDDGGFVIDCARLSEDVVDRRARPLLQPLKRALAVIVGVVDVEIAGVAEQLAALPSPTSVSVLCPAARGGPVGTLVDARGPSVLPMSDDDIVALDVPWLGLAPAGVDVIEGAFVAGNRLWLQRLVDPRWPRPVVRGARGDESEAALQALAAMVPVDRRR